MKLFDKYGRIHNYLRLSVTDKCNLNCVYCNPDKNYLHNLNNKSIISFEKIERIVRIFVEKFEFKKIRLTGGEPFARKDIEKLVQSLNDLKSTSEYELSATSNGILLKNRIADFINRGIDRFNFSLDTLQKAKFISITGSGLFGSAINSIMEGISISPKKVKINMVVMKGINDDELLDFVDFSIRHKVTVRFIEYMPFSNNGYDRNQFVSYKDMIKIISKKYKLINANNLESVSKDYTVADYDGKISFITSLSEHFCNTCNRLRVTSDGKLKLCLFSTIDEDLDIKDLIRSGATDKEIMDNITGFIGNKKGMHDELEKLIQLKSNSMISIGG
ncbi:MAG: GTP 3',8-cyclase MoaA [bacterium]